MRHYILSLCTIALLLAGCSEFNKALKSKDPEYKFTVAEKYYNAAQYEKALPLLEELISLTRGTARSETVNYYYAKSTFGMKDYIMANYYLANFVKTFPNSQYAEECAFLSAFCNYKNSPEFELDQSDTQAAISSMQLFMVRYPNSSLRDSCNTLIDIMRDKLEVKQYTGAMQYYKVRNYQAAGVALRNFLSQWPNSQFREEAMLTLLRADFQLAENSIPEKKEDRLKEAMRSYRNFADAFGQSDGMKEATGLNEELEKALSDLTTKAKH